MSLTRRVRALERAVNPSNCCEACGYDRTAPAQPKLSFAEPPVDGPGVCPECDRQLLIRISITRDTGGRLRSELV